MTTDTATHAPTLPGIQLPTLGTFLPEQGGYFHGAYFIGGQLFGEVTGPAAECYVRGLPWHPEYVDVPGARSNWDGRANTLAMAMVNSPLAEKALACRSGGFADWYVPARGGLLLQLDIKAALLDVKGEAFDESKWHWSSTQYDRLDAFRQGFAYGTTDFYRKAWEGGAARFARRFSLSA